MILAIGVALLGCVWHVPFHPEAAGLIVGLNAAVAAGALLGLLALGTVARRRPEAVVFVMLVTVAAAAVVLGLGHAVLGFVSVGYLLLLPVVVSLVIPWATKIHVTWLGFHGAPVLGYTLFAPTPSIPEGARDQLLGLLIVATAVIQSGHATGLRSRVSNFIQIQQIRALNRQARRDQARLDSLNDVLETTAATDALTGLGNRLALDAGLKIARSRIERQGALYGLLILDLDRFKTINMSAAIWPETMYSVPRAMPCGGSSAWATRRTGMAARSSSRCPADRADRGVRSRRAPPDGNREAADPQ